MLKENVTLIKEVNDLRKELKNSRTRIQDLETSLGISRKNAVQTTEAIVQALHVHQGNINTFGGELPNVSLAILRINVAKKEYVISVKNGLNGHPCPVLENTLVSERIQI